MMYQKKHLQIGHTSFTITSVRDNDEGMFLYTDNTDPAQDMRDFVSRILLLSFIEKIRVLQSNPVPIS
jgi:hypothetical protein